MDNFNQLPLGMEFLQQFWSQSLNAMPAMPTQASSTSAAPSPASASSHSAHNPLLQSLSAYLTPTFDVAELDKRINDLRTVASWLALNTKMLEGTIQALELQRTSLAHFSAMQRNFTAEAAAAPTAAAPAKKPAAKKRSQKKTTTRKT